MLKRFLNSFVGAAGWSAGTVVGARGGNDVYDWVKSGEARRSIGKLGRKTVEAAREATDALSAAADDAGEAVQNEVKNLRLRFSTEEAGPEGEARAVDERLKEERLSEDDRAALHNRRRAVAATIVVRCTHCDEPVRVAQGAELAQCPGCNRRFWIDLAERD